MTPEEIQAANAAITTAVAEPGQQLVVRDIPEASVLLVLPLAHAQALSMCANVGLEGCPDRVVGDLTWAVVSKLDEVVRLAKTEEDDDLAHKRMDDARAAALDDPRGEADR